MEDLASYGIPIEEIPLTRNYTIKTKRHDEYLSMRQTAERLLLDQNPNTLVHHHHLLLLIDLPTHRDVLLGKGKPIQYSKGNLRLFALIDTILDDYRNSTKDQKTCWIHEIVQRVVTTHKGRFLSKHPYGIWTPVSQEEARAKVGSMIRNRISSSSSRSSRTATTTSKRAHPLDT